MNTRTSLLPLLLAPLALGTAAAPSSAQGWLTTTRVSVSSTGAQANGESITNANSPLSLSPDGRFVAFNSAASNLVSGDTNGAPDVFVRDLVTGLIERVSVSSSGQQGSADGAGNGSYGAALSADGRYVAFYSYSSNLVTGDSGGVADVFVRDRLTGTTQRVSVSTSNKSPNGASQSVSISADGRYLAFSSAASNLVSSDRNRATDVFVRDQVTQTTLCASVSSTGTQGNGGSHVIACGNTLSADGHWVAFVSQATNLVAGDTNGQVDVFVRDLWSGTTERVSVTSAGGQADGFSGSACISADGRFVTFRSYAASLAPPGAPAGIPQLYVHDRLFRTTACASISPAGQAGDRPMNNYGALSADGRYVVFVSAARNLVAGVTSGYNLFVRDLVHGLTSSPTAWAGGWSWDGSGGVVAIDASGSTLAFDSLSANLVPGDTNDVQDVFVAQ